ncbi:hypothetical protein [Nocardioides zeae]|uniref:Uncharacterized protein n=1 Tax=Nocardioides zeae TaxID=1457234 RepID=A0AAJ1U704_9ACTN|nr:hypothetical protein [Nocardioides zeae]MDQ1106453.1 hypothetical protein [Nocardioides zeae]
MRVPLPRDAVRADRLTFDDDLFRRSRSVLGISVVNQSVWRFAGPVSEEDLTELHGRLAAGRLTRVLVPPRVPGARARWVPGVAPPVPVVTVDLPPADLMTWAEAAAEVTLDPERGPTWSLAAAVTTAGEGLLSLVTSHVVCDGGAHVRAVVEAAEGRSGRRVPTDATGPVAVGRRDDLRDALHHGRRVVRGLRAAVRAPRPTPAEGVVSSTSRPPPSPVPGGTGATPFRPPTVVAGVPSDAWHAAARAAGGTANSLLVALSGELLVRAGRVPPGRSLKVSLPVDTRGPDDLRSNATTGVSIVVDTTRDEGRVDDLAVVRARAKSAFAALADDPAAGSSATLEPLLQVLPDALVARAAARSAAPLCLCSNLGRLHPGFRAPFGEPADAVLMRSSTQGVTADLLRTRRGGVSSWWAEHGATSTHAVLGLDPDCWPDVEELREDLAAVYGRWGLTPTFW